MYKNFVYFVIFGMKKISLAFFILFIVLCINLSFWENSLCESELWYPPCIGGEYNSSCECIPDWTNPDPDPWTPEWWDWWNNNWWCDPSKIYTLPGWWTWCCPGVLDENWQCRTELADLGINLNTTCLINWQCSMNVYKLLQIRKRNQNPTVMGLFQDITLASTTAILWTVLTVALVISWLYFAIASISWKDTKRSKTIIIDCFVWLLLVMWSYTIIRLIQFLATAWW